MPTPHYPDSESAAESELQEELRGLFRIDTQTYLERYGQIAGHLTAESWSEDIQELYRCIHTIKGGAVTVGAEAILQLSTALEDLLSILRYLEEAPPLSDRRLSQALVEAGELVGAAPGLDDPASDPAHLEPMLDRLAVLHEQIRNDYVQSDWDDRSQLFYEFAEQGFDLVVLDLEMGLEHASTTGVVDDELIASAQATLEQLSGIGRDLEMAAGWEVLLDKSRELLNHRDLEVWAQAWPQHLATLKQCAKQGGESPPETSNSPSTPLPEALQLDVDSVSMSPVELQQAGEEAQASSDAIAALFDEFGSSDLDIGPDADTAADLETALDIGSDTFANDTGSIADLLAGVDFADDSDSALNLNSLEPNVGGLESDSDSLANDASPVADLLAGLDLTGELPLDEPDSEASPTETVNPAADIQVPVPLPRLDRCAQQLVETIQALRTSQQRYTLLRDQLRPLLNLARESLQSIAQLRQLQNDYTLLSTAGERAKSDNSPSPERYRQGYLTINRLLENNLRLTELGAEAERFVSQTSTSFQVLERNIQQLKSTVEESRLVSFRTLAFRSRAILRDLSTRYDKTARLVVEGEHLALDAGTIRRLEPLLLHLLRNAYDHGLESPEIRQALGKDPDGTIVLSLQRRGNRFQLCVRDDGGGIDPEAIAAVARAKQLPCGNLSTPVAMLDILTQPGFSSKATANEISGRGVGLDVVRQQVADLDGHMSLETALDRGTSFYIDIPVPHLLVTCIIVQSDRQQFAIPVEDIALTALAEQLQEVSGVAIGGAGATVPGTDSGQNAIMKWVAEGDGDRPPVPVLDLYQHWQGLPARTIPSTAICLRVDPPAGAAIDSSPSASSPSVSSSSVWLLADDLIEQVDLPVEELPTPMVSSSGVLGVSVQGDGRLIPVLDANALRLQIVEPQTYAYEIGMDVDVVSPLSGDADRSSSGRPTQSRTVQHVLVVDDAALMRRRIEASLTANGYRVTTKQDGLEAWNWLQENGLPDLVISDIEMPQMDGFTLLERCRSANFDMPFLVVSSRLSEEWSHEAERLGATDFLTKGFSTPELLKRVKETLATVPQLA